MKSVTMSWYSNNIPIYLTYSEKEDLMNMILELMKISSCGIDERLWRKIHDA